MDEEEITNQQPAGGAVLLAAPVTLAAADDPNQYRVVLVTQGRIRNILDEDVNVMITEEAIKDAVERDLFNALASFIDHHGLFDGSSSIRDLLGVWYDAEWSEEARGAVATLRTYPNDETQATIDRIDQILADREAGIATPDIGVSLVFYAEWYPRDNRDDPLRLKRFRHIESADIVFFPAVRSARILTQLSVLGGTNLMDEEEVTTTAPDPPEAETENANGAGDQPAGSPQPTTLSTPAATAESNGNGHQPGDGATVNPWLREARQYAIRQMLNASGLPAATRARLAKQNHSTPDQLAQAIDDARQELAALAEDNTIRIGGQPPRENRVSGMLNSLDRIEIALDAMLTGLRPQQEVQPLTGIRELYHLLSGDYEMTGMFKPERVQFAAVNSSTMAGLVANAMNKRVINMFKQYPRWWEPAVTPEDFNTLQDVRWITLGGVGELPTVNEGQAYGELTWDDQTETDSFVKKGGYLGITLEAIDKDDTTRLRAAPRALAQAAWMTLGKAIAAIFTQNSGTGPTMSDSTVLFHSNHNNVGSTALSFTGWETVKTAMKKQTELNSGERLAGLTAPYLLWVPVDRTTDAEQVLASQYDPGEGSTTAYQAINPNASGNERQTRLDRARARIIEVPFWTDTNNWAAQANPMLYPSIGLGYRYGRTPEIFSVASPTAGLMFTNDTMPVKVRFFFAVGPTDWRGLYKMNVA